MQGDNLSGSTQTVDKSKSVTPISETAESGASINIEGRVNEAKALAISSPANVDVSAGGSAGSAKAYSFGKFDEAFSEESQTE
ncbi:MAG: hypothetical protein ACK4PR_08820, partial [Gammaproteobacteria bacterium]